jgi:hypothetical protein
LAPVLDGADARARGRRACLVFTLGAHAIQLILDDATSTKKEP